MFLQWHDGAAAEVPEEEVTAEVKQEKMSCGVLICFKVKQEELVVEEWQAGGGVFCL